MTRVLSDQQQIAEMYRNLFQSSEDQAVMNRVGGGAGHHDRLNQRKRINVVLGSTGGHLDSATTTKGERK